uniref:3'-5' exonuclease domain-containing protein n=1 Tax=Oryza brachyantha TaxID=4533 RepID=J3L3V3_ORYBR
MTTSIVENFGDGTYTVAFDEDRIYTTLTACGEDVECWLDDILRIHRRRLNRLVVGLDVEWRPATYYSGPGPVAVLQICVGRRCLIFQILHADYVPDDLFDFLADDRFTFVGVGIQDDTLGKPGLRNTGLQGLVWEVLGLWPEKPQHVRVSAWDSPRLTLEQMKYACADAFASFEVGRSLYYDYG